MMTTGNSALLTRSEICWLKRSSTGTVGLQGTKADGNTGPVLEIEGHKTKSYFDAKRKEMGNAKFLNDIPLQVELQKCSQALGLERFNQ